MGNTFRALNTQKHHPEHLYAIAICYFMHTHLSKLWIIFQSLRKSDSGKIVLHYRVLYMIIWCVVRWYACKLQTQRISHARL